MSLVVVLDELLKQPMPETLWKLQPLLLTHDHPSTEPAREIAGQFFRYLNALRSAMEARQFPVLATAFAVGSTSINIAEEIFSPQKTNILRLSVDGLRLALDILGTYQFVRQWQPAFAAVHDATVWDLYGAFWKLSKDMQPDLDPITRAKTLDELFELVRNHETENALRLAVLVRLFQWGLVARLVPLLAEIEH